MKALETDITAITQLSEKDIPQVLEIEKTAFSSSWSLESFLQILSSPSQFYLVAKCEEKIVGYGGFEQVLDEGHIANLAVDPSFRREGIAQKLTAEIIAEAQKRSLQQLTLEVRMSNIAAQKLYARFGFKITRRRKGYYSQPAEDALIMTKLL